MGGISIWQLLIIFLIIMLLFGTKKLRNLGGDLGSAVKGFRSAMRDGEAEAGKDALAHQGEQGRVIEGEVAEREKHKV